MQLVDDGLHFDPGGSAWRMQQFAENSDRIAEQPLVSVEGQMVQHMEHTLRHRIVHSRVPREVQQQAQRELLE